MDLPQPPQDTELRNIIDKLAQFVARNGPEFEQMTKSKQKGNPKFQFLYGGEYFNYYQYKVTTEQAILRQQGVLANPNAMNTATSAWNQQSNLSNNNNSASIDQINQQQDTLREQIRQSEQNLTAQHTVLLQQQQVQVEAAVSQCEIDSLQSEADVCGIDLKEFDAILQPIIDSCTKDSISNGKSWILNHATTEKLADCIAHCLLLKVIQGTIPFSQKLHIIYLVNDVLHHCARKHADELKKSLEHVVVPMFCNASVGATDDQRNKLEKLLKLWESKANYLASNTVEKLRKPGNSYQQYQAQQVAKYSNEVSPLAQQTKATFDGYQAQHQAFVSHAMQQILTLQQQKQNLETQNTPTPSIVQSNLPQNIPSISSIIPPQTNLNQSHDGIPLSDLNQNVNPPTTNVPPNLNQPNIMQPQIMSPTQNLSQNMSQNSMHMKMSNMSLMNIPSGGVQEYLPPINTSLPPINTSLPPITNMPPMSSNIPTINTMSTLPPNLTSNLPPNLTSNLPPNLTSNLPPNLTSSLPPNLTSSLPPNLTSNLPLNSNLPPINPSVPPPNIAPNGLEHAIPFTQPPPGFLPGIFPDFSKPPPGFPLPPQPEVVEELMPSVPYYDLPAGLMIPLINLEDTGYRALDPGAIRLPPPAPPTERLLASVEAFYAIPSHDRPRDSEGWEKLGLYEYYKAKNIAKRQKEDQIRAGLRQKSRSPSPIVLPPTKSPSPPKRRYQSKSPSPPSTGNSGNSRRSPSNPGTLRRSRSRSPPRRRRSKSKRRRSDSRSQSRSPPPRDRSDRETRETTHSTNRSPTPPSFVNPFVKPENQELDESNKGHQMLRKMGWGGSGLGAKEQGIDAPISGGDVRDRQDQFKGIGMNLNDPYENFRKHKGAAFITRMKARAEERAQESKTFKGAPDSPE